MDGFTPIPSDDMQAAAPAPAAPTPAGDPADNTATSSDIPTLNLDNLMAEAPSATPSPIPVVPPTDDDMPVQFGDTTVPTAAPAPTTSQAEEEVVSADPTPHTQSPVTISEETRLNQKNDLGAFPKQVADQVEAMLEKSVEEEQAAVLSEERNLTDRKAELAQKRRDLEDAKRNIELQESSIKSQEEELDRHTLELNARKDRIDKAIKALQE